LKKNKISSHKLPKQQSTNFWSQGILGVKWVKYSCIPIINKNDMKKEVKSWVNLWMRRGLDLKIALLSMNSW
jgi:hypothetical protein